ncbi:hypothetical protein GOB93_13970 [Acetobacter musti]|uniref:Uncharacterized protein n=1 Tax=Acetobacter musti TaxID=864732 RepID=A0ABX0JRU3_9PROT|nr:hypothetical protein [Acetobacter musti]NHN85740.1 hypothetical protein [Acetobacter musti]
MWLAAAGHEREVLAVMIRHSVCLCGTAGSLFFRTGIVRRWGRPGFQKVMDVFDSVSEWFFRGERWVGWTGMQDSGYRADIQKNYLADRDCFKNLPVKPSVNYEEFWVPPFFKKALSSESF